MKNKSKVFLISVFSIIGLSIPFVVYAQTATSNCIVTRIGGILGEPELPPECRADGEVPDADRVALLAQVKQFVDEGKLSFSASNDHEGMANGSGEILRNDGTNIVVNTQVLRAYVYLVNKGFSFTVSCVVCNHKRLSSSGNVSRHWDGHASDISVINEQNLVNPSAKEVTIQYMQALNDLIGGDLAPDQLLCNGNGRVDPEVDALSMNDGRNWPGFTTQYVNSTDHQNHIHIGY